MLSLALALALALARAIALSFSMVYIFTGSFEPRKKFVSAEYIPPVATIVAIGGYSGAVAVS